MKLISPSNLLTQRQSYRIYAGLDLHCARSVLGGLERDGNWLGLSRFPTDPAHLTEAVRALGPGVCLTVEVGPLTRWAAGLLRPLVGKLVVCEPRHNRLIAENPNKCDEQDVVDLCLLLRGSPAHQPPYSLPPPRWASSRKCGWATTASARSTANWSTNS